MHTYESKQFLPISLAEAWSYFSDPKNLQAITPDDMDFQIVSDLSGTKMYEGQEIEYIVKPILGIPMKWKTLIKNVVEQEYFTDVQLMGPYKKWEHTHRFEELNGGVMMYDQINYELPWGIIGEIAHKLFVRNRIDEIFKYRYLILDKLFVKETVHAD
ncbi:MAG: SRPBCC family protein [Bacteroidia bacterium]|nr:SRPBCC family protein [Bacteroidia bacterium]